MTNPEDADAARSPSGQPDAADPEDPAPGRTRLDEGDTPTRLDQDDARRRDPAGDDLTRLDPGRPRRASGDDPTRLDRRGTPRSDRPGERASGRLPPRLAERFALIQALPGRGAEAALYLVREHGDEPQRALKVLKLYHEGRELEEKVWDWLAGDVPRECGIVRVFETDRADGQAYEVMEYLAGGDLSGLLARSPDRLDAASLARLAGQLAEQLACAHAAGIIHGDVKPRNILLRSEDPLDVALIDFGISTEIRPGEEFREADPPLTVRYAAPEWLLARYCSPRADWWSLGMTIAELAGRRHPLAGLDDDFIKKTLSNHRRIDLRAVTDRDLRLLCRGLLVQDEANRWGYDQVAAWLRGETPPIAEDQGPAADREPFHYGDAAFTDPGELADFLLDRWEDAARRLFPQVEGGSVLWRQLKTWLATLDGPGHGRRDRARLIRAVDRGREPSHVKLLRLLRWLDPALPPVYRRVVVTGGELPGLARRAIGNRLAVSFAVAPVTARDIISDLWTWHLLPGMAGGRDGTGLEEIDQGWRRLHEEWQAFAALLRRRDPAAGPLLNDIPEATVLPYLLWLAADESAAVELRAIVMRVLADLPADVPWYSALSGRDADAITLVGAVVLAGQAQAEARQIAADRAAARLRRQRLLEGQAVYAWYRRHARPIALGWAAAGVAAIAVLWSWVITLADVLPLASDGVIALSWALAILSITVFAAAELWLAAVIGGPYHPPYSLIGTVIHFGRFLRSLRGRGGVLLLILAGVPALVLGAAMFLPFLLPLASAAVQLVWARVRYGQWRADQEERERELAEARRERLAERRESDGDAGQLTGAVP